MKRRVLTFLCVAALARPAAAQTTVLTLEIWRGSGTLFEFGKESSPSDTAGPRRVRVQHTVWMLVKIGDTRYASRITPPSPAPVFRAVALASVDLPSVIQEVKSLDGKVRQ